MSLSRSLIRYGLPLVFMVVAGPASSLPTPAPVANATPNIKAPTCNDAMYRFLPGEFNFCMAGRDLSRGDYRGAMEMLDLAAGWGSKKAQYVLGVMHFRGESLPVDHALGLAWLTLAAERHDPDYLAVLSSAMHKSTPAELQRSKDLLSTMASVYADNVAARRAQRRFDRMVRELTYFEPYDVTVCIKGLTDGLIAEEDFTSSSCPSPRYAVARLHQISDVYFDGWAGHVSVGAAEPVLRKEPVDADKSNDR